MIKYSDVMIEKDFLWIDKKSISIHNISSKSVITEEKKFPEYLEKTLCGIIITPLLFKIFEDIYFNKYSIIIEAILIIIFIIGSTIYQRNMNIYLMAIITNSGKEHLIFSKQISTLHKIEELINNNTEKVIEIKTKTGDIKYIKSLIKSNGKINY
jgi:hypothetical protein